MAFLQMPNQLLDIDAVVFWLHSFFQRLFCQSGRLRPKLSLKFNAERSMENTSDSSEKSFIFLKVDKKLVRIKYNDIHFIESLKDYIKVFTSEGDFLAHKSLTSITEELPKSKFLRIHRSFTVSLDKIEALEGNSVLLKGKRIPIGRKYVNHAKDVILNA